MALTSGQRRHLISTYASVSHMLRQMEEAATEGRSPTGVGSPLTRLSPLEVEAIFGSLRRLETKLKREARALAPEELAAFEEPQSTHNTRVWLSNLLEKVRQAVDSLQPDQMRKYGSTDDSDGAKLASLHSKLSAEVQTAREQLDAELRNAEVEESQ
jgi:hypothetical protein